MFQFLQSGVKVSGMKEIPILNCSEKALIDDSDFGLVSKFVWRANYHRSGNIYVQTGIKNKTVKLHRFITGAKTGEHVDHKNHDCLDNQRDNLRICTNAQNQFNRQKLRPKTSIYKGVFKRENGKWRAAIRMNGVIVNIGTYSSEVIAAAGYDAYAEKMFGNFALTNNTSQKLRDEAMRLRIEPKKKMDGKSRFRGVTLLYNLKWQARITQNKVLRQIGVFDTQEAAALAYNEEAVKAFGHKALLNKL